MKRMLFNATQSEELRVAIVNDNKLEDLDFERGNKEQRKSNIYKAIITRVEPSLEAAFVNYGVDRHGFLPFKEISPEYYSKKTRKKDISIKDVISEGQELIIQVTKEERGNKGAALTSYLSLAGRYIVLMPNNKDGGGISRRIEGDERSSFKDVLSQIKIKKGTSVIGRTAGIGATVEQIQWDLDYLTQLWDAIENAANAQEGPFLIYQESNLVIRAIRDYFSTDIEEVLIDKKEIYDQALQFMSHVMPNYSERVKFYDEDTSLFTKFNIENQIESAFLREVQLPSGGAIVIEEVEVLDLIKDNGQIKGLKTSQGDISCEKVICCAGQWTRTFAEKFGINVPLVPFQHQYLVTEKIEGVQSNLPTLRDPDRLIYFKEEVGGLVMGGYEPNPKSWAEEGIPKDFHYTLLDSDFDHFEELMTNALGRVPLLETAGVKELINGPESFTPDGNFILGQSPEQNNFFVGGSFLFVGEEVPYPIFLARIF